MRLRPFAYGIRLASAIALAIGLIVPRSAHAQRQSGSGYLFGTPAAHLTLRAGYARASANSDLFEFAIKQLTLSKSAFSGPALDAEFAVRLGERIDFTLDAGYAFAQANSEFRSFVDNNDKPIEQTTTFQRVPLTANVKVYLVPRGRSIGKLAWIPNKLVPWIGAGGGSTWYRFRQQGDFVNFRNNNVFAGDLETGGWTPALQGMGGVDVTLTPRFAVGLDARTLWAKGDVGSDFSNFDKIDLSGVSATIGFTIRM